MFAHEDSMKAAIYIFKAVFPKLPLHPVNEGLLDLDEDDLDEIASKMPF